MSRYLRITTIASLVTTIAAVVATPADVQARTKFAICDPGVPQSILCLEGLWTCSSGNPASTCAAAANFAGCGGVTFDAESYCSNEPDACGVANSAAVVCIKAS